MTSPVALPAPAAIPMILTCPACGQRHIDEGEFSTKAHHTHACQHCGMVWRPAIPPTVGVRFLPGFKNEPAETQAPEAHAGLVRITDLLEALLTQSAVRYREILVFADKILYAGPEHVRLAITYQAAAGVARGIRCGSHIVYAGPVPDPIVQAAKRRAIAGAPCVALLRGAIPADPHSITAETDWNRIFPLEWKGGQWTVYRGPYLEYFKEALIRPWDPAQAEP